MAITSTSLPVSFYLCLPMCFNIPTRFHGMIFLWLRRSTQHSTTSCQRRHILVWSTARKRLRIISILTSHHYRGRLFPKWYSADSNYDGAKKHLRGRRPARPSWSIPK
jgi:hypothetical protein